MKKMNINKVYTVSNSDDKIRAIFTDKDKAEAYVQRLKFIPRNFFERYGVMVRYLNPDFPDIPMSAYAYVEFDLGYVGQMPDIKIIKSRISFSDYPFSTKYDNPYGVTYDAPFFHRQLRIEHKIPIYPDDTWYSIGDRGYKVLKENLEKWKVWQLKKNGH